MSPVQRDRQTERGGTSSVPQRSRKGPQARRIRAAMGADGANPPKPSQRWRLVESMVELSAKSGHNELSIGQLCAGAGVSPVSFYDLFGDKEGLLVAAYRACAERIFGPMRSALEGDDVAQVPALALRAMLEAVAADPDGARIVFVEALGGGEVMLAERRQAFARFEARVQQYLERVPKHAMTLDIPVVAVAGALRAIVARHLRTRTEDQLPGLVEQGLAWLYAYARAPGSRPWSESEQATLACQAHADSSAAVHFALERLPPGRHRLPSAAVARSQRTRILLATAEVVMQMGYAQARVEDIASRARVGKTGFYEHFADKRHAFLEAQHYPTQFILDRCAEAYFSASEWPRRMWRMLGVLLSLIAANPAISHLRLVECYAAGPEAIRRAEEITRAFTIFLHEGYQHRERGASLPRLCSAAVTGAIFEIVQRQIANGATAAVTSRLPQIAYIALAPFMGAEEAIGQVQAMLAGPPVLTS